jgi:Polyketide cyclase / dehydrase and lipid transport
MNTLWRICRALFWLLIVAIVVLIAEGYRKDAGVVHVTLEINATPERIWPWLDEGDRAKQWVHGLVEVRGASSPSANPVGRSEVWVLRDDSNGGKLMEVTGTCTEYNKPSRLGVHLSSAGAFDGDQTYQLTGVGSRTRFEMTGRFKYQGWFYRLLEPFITPAAQRQMELDVARLKGLVEKS